ncbi:MAG: hypothetical protein IJ493_10010 [Clostridia bacterium]|nr:hypothetical protein [Clostridia bacterium]
MIHLFIKNCRVFDGSTFMDGLQDIAVCGDAVTSITPAGTFTPSEPIHTIIDARGAMASAGFIDMHAHVYPLWESGVYSESTFFPYCVTSAADAGSAGSETIRSGLEGLASCRADIRCFVNIAPAGLATLRCHPEYIDPAYINADKLHRLFAQYGDRLAGLKVRLGSEVAREHGVEPLKAAAKLAREIGTRLMVHTTNPPVPMDEICSYLAPGDIFSHAFHDHGRNILDENGQILPGVCEAKERGVIFDIGDAGWHFSFDVLRAALAQGIAPDTISTDITDNNMLRSGMFCLPMVMTKALTLGMALEDVLRAVTVTPGRALGLPQRLENAGTADIALFTLREHSLTLKDGNNNLIEAGRYICPLMTVKRGAIVWRDMSI